VIFVEASLYRERSRGSAREILKTHLCSQFSVQKTFSNSDRENKTIYLIWLYSCWNCTISHEINAVRLSREMCVTRDLVCQEQIFHKYKSIYTAFAHMQCVNSLETNSRRTRYNRCALFLYSLDKIEKHVGCNFVSAAAVKVLPQTLSTLNVMCLYLLCV